MKTRTIINSIAAVIVCAVSLTSCQKNFVKYNTNPYEASQEQMEADAGFFTAYLTQLQRSVIFFRDGTYLDSDYQLMYNLCAELWCGYMAPSGGFNSGVNTGSFYIMDGWTRAMFVNKYTYCMNAWYSLYELAKEQENDEILALADIIKVMSMVQVADYYGPIPYSEVGTTLTPNYDPLNKVYEQFFEELDFAVETLYNYIVEAGGSSDDSSASSVTFMSEYDYVYGGKVVNWIKLANSLRLRLAMRMAYVDPEEAQNQAETAINAVYGVLEANTENAALPSSLVDHHPIYEINVNFNDGDCQLNADMQCYLNGYNDPRISAFATNLIDGKVYGMRNGVHSTVWTPYRNSAGKMTPPNATNYKIVWMNAAEVWLLRAEGALRGWDMGTTAQDAYESGITASFEQWGVSAGNYLSDNTSVPAAFVDNTGNGADAAAPSTITIAWNEGDGFETSLERIITQKWLALFPNGVEAWAEYRRTHYPKLLTPVNNDSNGIVDSDLQIRRVPYPISEQTDNPTGRNSGVSNLGGPDNAATKLWWDKNY